MKLYRKKFGFIRNKGVRNELLGLDPAYDHCRMVQLLTGYEFPWDMVRALEIALMRTFCSPRISALLHRTGEFRKHGQKRYDDTALLVAEFMQHGYDGERGRQAIDHMNKIHGIYRIENEDFLFVLSTFIFEPIHWIDHYGWRKTTVAEKKALFLFFREVGLRMRIRDIPPTLAELEKFVEEYEQMNFSPAETNHAVGNATVNIVKGWMPFFVRPFVLPVMKCLLSKKMLRALGYSNPSLLLKLFVRGAMKLRVFFLRGISFKKYPSFVTTEHNLSYPKGYKIEKLGPENIVKKIS